MSPSAPTEAPPVPGVMPADPAETRRKSRLSRLLARGRDLPPLPDADELRRVIEELRPAWDQPAPPVEDEPGSPANLPELARASVEQVWGAIPVLEVDLARLDAALVVTGRRADPAHAAFDVLRAKMSQAMAERGWTRVGITSPTKGCGKSFLALNLAVTFARVPGARTVLLDLDMRQPSLAWSLGVVPGEPLSQWLLGRAPAPLRRLAVPGARIEARPAEGLAVGLNAQVERDAAEILLDPAARRAVTDLTVAQGAGMVICDLPPALAQDDVIAAEAFLDCVLIVAAGGRTTARDLQETARRLGPNLPVLGVVLNRGEGRERFDYAY